MKNFIGISQGDSSQGGLNGGAIGFPLNDNTASSTVFSTDTPVGSFPVSLYISGSLSNTKNAFKLLNGQSTFYLQSATDYVSIAMPKIWQSALVGLFTKSASNPLLSGQFGQVVPNPAGGWYLFTCNVNVYRYESTDLINWTNQTLCISGTGVTTDFDDTIQVASVIMIDSSHWVMLFRGATSALVTTLGRAISSDGTTWTKYGTAGIASGRFTSCDNGADILYDPAGISLNGGTFYCWIGGGSEGHGSSRLFTTSDLYTASPVMTEVTPSPRFTSTLNQDHFCGSQFYYNGNYYFVVARDFQPSSSHNLYDHVIGLYRSTEPTFQRSTTDFLGYVVVNDQTYDVNYVDTPTVAVDDSKRTLSAALGDSIKLIYCGDSSTTETQDIAVGSISNLAIRTPVFDEMLKYNNSYVINFQADTLSDGLVLFSCENTYNGSSPTILCCLKLVSGSYYVNMFLGSGYRRTTTAISANTPYKVVVTDDGTTTKVYINGVLSTFNTDSDKLLRPAIVRYGYMFIGCGYGNTANKKYMWDFRMYPTALTQAQVTNLQNTNNI